MVFSGDIGSDVQGGERVKTWRLFFLRDGWSVEVATTPVLGATFLESGTLIEVGSLMYAPPSQLPPLHFKKVNS